MIAFLEPSRHTQAVRISGTVAGFLNMGYNEVEAQLAAISEVSKHFDIMFKEVTDNDGCARE